tara:strand:- start:5115 stop:5447 length:333 start_codon:yes stop_codon:yes gene_type:complete
MIILNKSTSPQSFSFIAKSKTYDSLHITDESTNTSVEVTIDSITSGDYVDSITATFDLVEDRYYSLELKNGSETVLKDKVFCTNQAHSTYSVNKDVYTENTTTNDYIVYE